MYFCCIVGLETVILSYCGLEVCALGKFFRLEVVHLESTVDLKFVRLGIL
jgi:hypothetical protein